MFHYRFHSKPYYATMAKGRQWVALAVAICLLTPSSWSFNSPYSIPRRRVSTHRQTIFLFSSASQTDADSNGEPPLDQFRLSQYHLEDTTSSLLKRNEIGTWTPDRFDKAQQTMIAWSERPNRRSAVTVERLLRRVVEEKIAGNKNALGLDMVTMYTALLQIWAKSGATGAAPRSEEILDTMQAAYEEEGDVSIKPDISAFNAVLLAYAQSQRADAPQQSMRVLQKLYDWNKQGKTDVVPNKESYTVILKAYANAGGQEAPSLLYKMIVHMEKLSQEGFPAVKPDYHCHNVYLGALLVAITQGTVPAPQGAQRAEDYLQQMMANESEDAKPDTWSFNIVISAWSKSGATERAEGLLLQLRNYHGVSGGFEKTRPNTYTYNCLIACYGRSTLRDKAQRAHMVLDRMKTMVEKGSGPDVVTYNSVMNAYAKSRVSNSPQKVEELLRELVEVYETTGDSQLRPNSRSFNVCVDAWAKSNLPNSAERILDWIECMQKSVANGRNSIRPNKWTYNAYLQALGKSGKSNIGQTAEDVLEQMEKLVAKGGIQLKPDVYIYSNVIHCLAVSGADNSLERAFAILSRMEDLHAAGYGDVRPNAYTYNCVINAAAKSKKAGKAKIAFDILRRMQSVALTPQTVTYNNVINACAFSGHPKDDPKEVLQIALELLREAQQTCGANHITYGTSLRVICNFEADPSERWRLTRETFQECCADGQLTGAVLGRIKYATTPAQYALLHSMAADERTGKLREECIKNARQVKLAPLTKRVIA